MNDQSQEKVLTFKKINVNESQKYQATNQAKYISKNEVGFAAIRGGDKVFSRGQHLSS